MKITRESINPALSNAENARILNVDPTAVSRARKRLGFPPSPRTKTKLPAATKAQREREARERSYAYRREQRAGIDWRMSNLEVAMRYGVSVAQVIRWRKESGAKAKPYSKRNYIEKLIEAEAKLSERKTVHGWLNMADVPQTEFGKPICLLRRLAIHLGVAPWRGDEKPAPQPINSPAP